MDHNESSHWEDGRWTPSAFICVRQRIKTALAGILGLGSVVLVTGQYSLTTLNATMSFLENGLTTLGVLSAAVTVLAQADLAYESMLRDWQYTVMDTGSEADLKQRFASGIKHQVEELISSHDEILAGCRVVVWHRDMETGAFRYRGLACYRYFFVTREADIFKHFEPVNV